MALVVLSVIFTARSPVFLSEQNIRGMLADSRCHRSGGWE